MILDHYGNNDLAAKHQDMKRLAQDLHRKFSVAAAEIREEVDDPERCVIGLTLVGSTHQEARQQIDRVLAHLDDIASARVVTQDIDVFQFE